MGEPGHIVADREARITDRDALIAAMDGGFVPKFLMFWGHSSHSTTVGPHVLSQWYEAPFTLDGHRFPTAEHWMMAQKAGLFEDTAAAARILAAPTPAEAKAIGREVRDFDGEVWDACRLSVVTAGNVLKFGQHPELCEFLLRTGDKVLVEASPTDTVWGIGLGAGNPAAADPRTWRGSNLLGFALMAARERLRRFPAPTLPADAPRPPWEVFPGEHPLSLCWRMGAGEAHLVAFGAWWTAQSADVRVVYELVHPAHGVWSGWYQAEDPG